MNQQHTSTPDDICVSDADLRHHLFVCGTGSGLPTPVDLVRMGVKPRQYLDQFDATSGHWAEIQSFKADEPGDALAHP